MEEDGVVSVWAGWFETAEALLEYAAEEGCDQDGTPQISPFNRDFFDGEELWPFDPDFWERALVEPTADPEALLLSFSEGTAIGPALRERFPNGLGKTYNAAILVYNYRYDEPAHSPDKPVMFLAAVPYDD